MHLVCKRFAELIIIVEQAQIDGVTSDVLYVCYHFGRLLPCLHTITLKVDENLARETRPS
jgi:hypothetical protein